MNYIKTIRTLLDNPSIQEIPIKKPKIKVKLIRNYPINEIDIQTVSEENPTEKSEEIQIEEPITKFLENEQELIGLFIIQDINFEQINKWLQLHKEDKLLINNLLQLKILTKKNQIPTFPIEVSTIESWSKTIKNLIETEIKIPRKYITKILPFKTIGSQYYYIVFVREHKTNYYIPNSLNWFPGLGDYKWDIKTIVYKHNEYDFEIENIQDFFNYLNEIEREKQWINRNYSIENSHNIIGLNTVFETIATSA
jgi:hypothetical protein